MDFAVKTILDASATGLVNAFDKAAKGSAKFRDSVEAAFKKSEDHAHHAEGVFSKVFAAIGAERLIEKGIEKLAELPKAVGEFAEKGDFIARTSLKIGVSAEYYQKLAYAMKMVDIPAETMIGAFEKLNKGTAQLRVGQGPMEAGLKRIAPALMVAIRASKNAGQAFELTAEAIKNTSDPAKRAAIATAVFGKSGQELIPILLKGKDGVHELMAEADKMGIVMSDSAVAGAEAFDDGLKRLKATQEAVGNAIMGKLLPALQPLLDKFQVWVDKNKDLIVQDILGVINGIAKAIEFLGKAWDSGLLPALLAGVGAFIAIRQGMLLAAAASAIFETINTIIFAFQAVTTGAATAQEGLNLVMASNPIMLIVIGVAALVAGFVLLTKQLGGVVPALQFLGQALLKTVLLPINLVIDGVRILLLGLSKLPGVGGIAKSALEGLTTFQNKTNQALTGSSGQVDYAGTWKNAKAPNNSAVGVQANLAMINRTDVSVTAPPGYGVETKTRSSGNIAPGFSGYPTSGDAH